MDYSHAEVQRRWKIVKAATVGDCTGAIAAQQLAFCSALEGDSDAKKLSGGESDYQSLGKQTTSCSQS